MEVGGRVRVRLHNGISARATIATLTEDEAEVLLDKDGAEHSVPLASLFALEPFEVDSTDNTCDAEMTATRVSASQRKERGNILFRLGDFDAAIEQYVAALKKLKPQALSPGAPVIVSCGDPSNGSAKRYRPGTVATVSGNVAEVLFDDDSPQTGDVDEAEIPVSRLVLVGDPVLQSSVYLNLAKAAAKRGDRLEPVAYAHRAVCTTHHIPEQEERPVSMAKALLVLARAELNRSNFNGAEHAADQGELLSPGDKQWAQLRAEAGRKRAQRHLSNKRLAKEVSMWVNDVMDARGQEEQAECESYTFIEKDEPSPVAVREGARAVFTPHALHHWGAAWAGTLAAVILALVVARTWPSVPLRDASEGSSVDDNAFHHG
mmetsp:Transcript_25416/g.68803  ORF Transcript_25416/g.68803 Transcript_25416/m.68803 type:complete len:376 (-) Transcript_25416:160-1287(-)